MIKCPYHLSTGNGGSEEYYQTVRKLADETQGKADVLIGGLLYAFAYFSRRYEEKPRCREELIVEALGLGVMWKVYGGLTEHPRPVVCGLLAGIEKLRRKSRLKPLLNVCKGALLGFAYPPGLPETDDAPSSARQIGSLCSWIDALGDMEYENKRWRQWAEYFGSLSDDDEAAGFRRLMELENWFEARCDKALAGFTGQADVFIRRCERRYRWREDRFFCLRRPAEYHYNMVGSELLGRAYREEFCEMKKKMILLPVCTRKRVRGCRAGRERLGLVCSGCTPDCMANRITKKGVENGYRVYLIPHESSAFTGKEPGGIIGVSCVTRLVEGGFMARALGFAPQCVVLDCCGCRHWSRKTLPTSISLKELAAVMGTADQQQ